MKKIKKFLLQIDYILVLAVILASFLVKVEDITSFGIRVLITIGIYTILDFLIIIGKYIASCFDLDFSFSLDEDSPEEKTEISNYDRALDLLARESISTINEKNLCLKGCIRVVPLEAAVLFVQKLQDESLEKYYQEHKETIDYCRHPEKSKPILESLGIKIKVD